VKSQIQKMPLSIALYSTAFSPFLAILSEDLVSNQAKVLIVCLYLTICLVAFIPLVLEVIKKTELYRVPLLTTFFLAALVLQADLRSTDSYSSFVITFNSVLFISACLLVFISSLVKVSFDRYVICLSFGSLILVSNAFLSGNFGSSRSGLVLGTPINIFGSYISLTLVSIFYLWSQRSIKWGKIHKFVWSLFIIILFLGLLHSASISSILTVFVSSFVFYFVTREKGKSALILFLSVFCLLLISSGIKFSPTGISSSKVPISKGIVEQRTQGLSSTDTEVGVVAEVDNGREILVPRTFSSVTNSAEIRISIYTQNIIQFSSAGLINTLFGSGSEGIKPVFVKVENGLPPLPHGTHSTLLSIFGGYGLTTLAFIATALFLRLKKAVILWEHKGWVGLFAVFLLNCLSMDIQWTYLVLILSICIGQFRSRKLISIREI
jgi:hypothetical protein